MEDNFVKVINATYKVLNFLPEGEPLKNKAKEKVLAILENLTLVSSAKGWVSLKKESAAVRLLNDIEILETYLKLGKYQGWIDNINFLILSKEYDIIKRQIKPPQGLIKQSLEIIPEVEKTAIQPAQKLDALQSGGVSEKFSERQDKILKILSERGKIQVADIIKEIPNITKRTIRRDLDNLLKKGEIVRIGEFNQVFYQK